MNSTMKSTVKLIDQKRSGLFPEHDGIEPIRISARATIPAVELLREAGATVVGRPGDTYEITLSDAMPAGLVACHINDPPHRAIRLDIEPEWPDEHPDYWGQVELTPCPACGAPVIWYEAGHVPGYRVCTRPPHHHSLAR